MSLGINVSTHTQRQWIALILRLNNIHPRLGGVEPEDSNSRVLSMSLHKWNASVERHWAVELVFKYICVVQAIRLRVISIPATGLFQ